jgi:hypothetical protein
MAIVLDGTNGVTTNSGTLISATTIGVGGATPSTSGAGITFPATQSASTDANTLDDYEEGTFTPVITPGSGSLTAHTATGNYTKIGRLVTLNIVFTITTAGTASGTATYTIPFTSSSNAGANATGSVRETAATGNWFFTQIGATSSSATIWTSTNGGITWTNSYTYVWSITYIV